MLFSLRLSVELLFILSLFLISNSILFERVSLLNGNGSKILISLTFDVSLFPKTLTPL